MIALPFVALVVGALLAVILGVPHLAGAQGQYLAVGCLAGFDTVLGGIRGGLEDRFDNAIFISGFLTNVVIAMLLCFLGDKIYQPMYLAVAFIFGSRIFNNLSLIRRMVVTRVKDELERRKRQAALATSTEPNA